MNFSNEAKKVVLENIVYLEGSSYQAMERELCPDWFQRVYNTPYIDENRLLEYLLRWWYPGEHSEDTYNASDVNTNFLGYERKIGNDTFLLAHNSKLRYASLSRIIRYE